jgi:putative nucleotidyltransferase with HDIG domain
VEIPQQGDVHGLWKTEAKTPGESSARLPNSDVACNSGERGKRKREAGKAKAHDSSLSGTDGMTDGITLKGEVQADPLAGLRWFFGFEGSISRREWALVAYATSLSAMLFSLLAALIVSRGGLDPTWPVVALACSALVADRQSVRLTPGVEISVSFLPIVLAAVIYGPIAAVVVSIASLLLDFRVPHARWLLWTSSRSLAAGAAGIAASALQGSKTDSFGRIVAVVAVATIVDQVVDFVLGSLTARLRGRSFREMAGVASTIWFAIPLYTPLTAVLVYAYGHVSPWSVVLFLAPAFAAQKLFLLYQEQRATSEKLSFAVARQEKAHLSFATALVATLDARDRYTAGHSAAVAIYARDVAERLGLSEADQHIAHLCGLVHDIGKVGLPAGLLEKPGPLNLEERRQMEEHPVIGERILANVEDYEEIANVVRHHHERVDGQGYPDKLVGDEIPIIARIIAVADAYDAMTSDRPYRDAMPSRVARLRIAQSVGSQFDTGVVAAFEAILAQATENYRNGFGSRFSFGVQAQSNFPIPRKEFELTAEAS